MIKLGRHLSFLPKLRYCFAFIFCSSANLFAAPASSGAVQPLPASAIGFQNILQVIFGLTLVLLAIMVTAWLIKKYAPGQASSSGRIKVIGGVAVGPKERVVILEIADTWLVVGVAPGQVTSLHTMDKKESSALPHTDGEGQNFAAWLKNTLQRRPDKPSI